MNTPKVRTDIFVATLAAAIVTHSIVDASTPLTPTLPAGSIVMYAGNLESIPAGYLLCDGRELNASTYPALAAALGTTWGSCGTATCETLRLPDLRGVFPRFLDLGRGVDPGRKQGELQGWATGRPSIPFLTDLGGSHEHAGKRATSVPVGACNPEAMDSGACQGTLIALLPGQPDGTHGHAIGAGGDLETRPTNHALVALIRF